MRERLMVDIEEDYIPRETIDEAIKKIIKEYGTLLKQLAKE